MRLDEIPPPEGLPPRVKQLLHRLDTDDGVRHLWWVLWAVLALAVAVFIGRGGSRPADPSFENGSGATASGSFTPSQRIAGFKEAALHVESDDGERTWCAVVADTEATRRQGMMGRHDMAGYDAMVFTYPTPSDEQYWMRNTPLPLTIGWFSGNGILLGQTDMPPCPDRADCPNYPPPGRYRFAIEVPKGGFDRLGIGSGTQVSVGGACE